MAATEKEVKAKAEIETVTMSDGRKVDFAGKRKMLKESIFNSDGSLASVRLDFRNGQFINFEPPAALSAKAEGHGWEQKLGDETAGVDDVDDMYLAVEELAGRLQNGEWSLKREGGGMAGTSVLLRALMEFSGRTQDQVKEFLTGKSQAEKLALRNSPKVKPIVERLEAEKIAKGSKVDTAALDAGLEAFAHG